MSAAPTEERIMSDVMPGDLFLSNCGSGPYAARLLRISNGVAHMERWDTKSKAKAQRRVKFDLAVEYLRSERCGWRRS